MCVIGFDDNQHGGALRIRNSWGAEFGDNGDFWIRSPTSAVGLFQFTPKVIIGLSFHVDKADEIWFELQPTG